MAPNSPAIFFSIDVLHISGRNAGIPQREPLPNVPDCGDWRLAAGAGTSSRPVQEVEQQPAELKAEYSDSLRRANQYIADAKNVLDADPNDEEARRSLMEAYQQKAMLFEFALDRSLP